jgi:hypothetical protein
MRQTVESRFRAATFVLAVGASPRQAAPNGWRAGLIRQYDLFCAIIFLTCSRVGLVTSSDSSHLPVPLCRDWEIRCTRDSSH